MNLAVDQEAAPRPRYLPYAAGSFRMAMGLQALDSRTWMQPLATGYREIA